MAAETSPPSAPDPDEKSDEQSSSLPLWLVVLAVLALGGVLGIILYWGHVGKPWWEGDDDKKFWDYLELLIVPAAIAIGVAVVTAVQNARQRQTEARQRERESTAEEDRRERERKAQAAQRERELAVENERAQAAALQAYLDHMSQLLTDKDRPLRRAQLGDGLSAVARARTLTTLRRLDAEGKSSLLQFLYQSGLIYRRQPVISLAEADLSEANLRAASPTGADLRGVILRQADLTYAFLIGVDLSGANLMGANLRTAQLTEGTCLRKAVLIGADLRGANLRDIDLSGAALSGADLRGANLRGANLRAAVLAAQGNQEFVFRTRSDLQQALLRKASARGADLSGADLSDAKVMSNKQLERQAYSLKGTTMPDGQKYEDWVEKGRPPRGPRKKSRPHQR